MKTHSLKAEKRTVSGRKVKVLRQQDLIPANLYGKKIKSQAIQVSQSDFANIFREVGETGLVELQLGQTKHPVLISNVQVHPVLDTPLHVDFRQVDLKEKVTASVPVILEGESPAEKQSLGTVVQQLNEIEVEALPTDLPEHLIADISQLAEVDQAVHAKDLKYDSKAVTLQVSPEQIIAKVEPPQKEEEPAPVVEEETAEEGKEKEPATEAEAATSEDQSESEAPNQEASKGE